MTNGPLAGQPEATGDEPGLLALVDDLRRIERRRLEATPGSSEYIEVLGFERALVERIRERVGDLDCPPHWAAADPPGGRAGR